uniref:Checkpoint protein n=1 Tax=Globodera pallida TaxID=36090 RepID=A0A183CDS4_GLOPA
MRFVAVIGDGKAVDIFFKVVVVVSKLCRKRCVVRVTPNEFSFVNVYNVREGMHVHLRIHKDHLFNSWSFDGLSPDNNAIFFELSTDDFVSSLHSRANQIKLKMTKKDGVPHLRVELSANSLVNEIPIVLVVARQWPDFNPPNMGLSQLAVALPPVKTLTRIISGVKDIGGRHLIFRANNKGEFNIIAHADQAKVAVYAQGLHNQSISGAENLSQTVQQPEHFYGVTLDIRNFHAFLGALQSLVSQIFDGHGAIFIAQEPECNLTLCLAGINQE